MASRHRSAPSGDLPDALRTWCEWIYLHSDLAIRAAPDARTWDGKPATWLDMMGQARERPLLEAAMRAGVWHPPLPDDEDIFA
jgi:hypothetical protein